MAIARSPNDWRSHGLQLKPAAPVRVERHKRPVIRNVSRAVAKTGVLA